jgi:ABC-type Fe3+ transport system permease subunit
VALFAASAFDGDVSSYGVVALLAMVAAAVFLFTYFGSIRESYSILLKIGDYSKKKREENKVIGAVAAVVWPLAVCIFLITGFIYGKWYINWIVFPITGLLFGMFSAVYSIVKGNNDKKYLDR